MVGATMRMNTCRRVLVAVDSRASCLRPTSPKRSFFASSTDHTALLRNAKVHTVRDEGKRQYLLVPDTMPLDIVLKEPKLGLACLHAERNILFGAKVINRTLGTPAHVCGRLLDAALADASLEGQAPLAKASLDGLSDWVLQGIDGTIDIDILSDLAQLDSNALATLKSIVGNEGNTKGKGEKELWRRLASEFVHRRLSEEAELYKSNGGSLLEIEVFAETTKSSLNSAGTLAVYSFA